MNAPSYPQAQRRLAVLFAVPFAFGLAFFAVTLFSDHTDLELQRVQNLTSCVARLRFLSSDIEIGEHGFLLTGGERYLIPLEQANQELPSQIRVCQRNASFINSPPLQAQVNRMVSLVRSQASQAAHVLQVFYESGPGAALDLVKSDEAAESANKVRRVTEDVEQSLATRHASVLDMQRAWNRFGYFFFVVGIIAMVLVMVRLYHAAIGYLRGRDELQAKLQELNQALESEVEQRTRDLTVANEELQQFAYVASHDLQEPLRTITSFTQLIDSRYRGKLDEDADEFIGFIVTASRRMTDLINGLLAMVRLRKSGHPTDPVSFDEIMADVQSNLAVAILESGAVVEYDHMPALIVDRVQVLQLLQNLVSNAIKYRRPGVPPRVTVSARRESTHWIFSVADDGRGFNQQFADRIFGMFQRLPSEDSAEGTGIGLSIARKIAERHGGRIWAESEEGQGASFHFTLPVSLEPNRNHTQPRTAAATVNEAPLSRSRSAGV